MLVSSRTVSGAGSVCAMESDMASTSALNPTGAALSDYQMERLLGRGKYSQVFLARDRKTGQLVAIKRVEIFDMMDANSRDACLKEVKILQNVEHPNIVKCFKYFIQDNELVIVLEWAEAGDLANIIKERQAGGEALPTQQVWAMFHQVCCALKHMHERRMMHRDLKPSNIFCTASGELKLGDLGLSRYFSSRTLQANTTVGTPYYMSPECIKGQPYDFSSDVWSLGCLLYELVALHNPFYKENQSLYMLGKSISACSYAPLPATVPEGLRQLVASMLQPAPASRPTISQIAEYVEQHMQQQQQQQQEQQLGQLTAQMQAQAQAQAAAAAAAATAAAAAAAAQKQYVAPAPAPSPLSQSHSGASAMDLGLGFGIGLGMGLGVTGFGIQIAERGGHSTLPRGMASALPR